jgi:putative membrane protein
MCIFDHWGSFYWPFWGFFNIIFWVLVICGIVYLFQNASKHPSEEPKKQDAAMDILRKRYAAGEINAEEFAQKKKDLES